jgi:hypothetical protein
MNLNERELQALRMIDNGTRMRLTHHGNVLVSRQAKRLRELGLIRQAPESWIAYEPTSMGKRVLLDNIATDLRTCVAGKMNEPAWEKRLAEDIARIPKT